MKKTLLTLLTAGYMLFNSLSAKAQTVSGQITDLFNNQPIPSAAVQINNFGSDTTDENGFYSITSSGVSPYIIVPEFDKPEKVKIFNNNGQLVNSLENITESSKWDLTNKSGIPVSNGIYFLQFFDKNNNALTNKVSVLRGYAPVRLSVPNNVAENSVKSGRSINDIDDISNVTIIKDGFYDRRTFMNYPINNVEFNEGLIPVDSLFLDHMNTVLIRSETWGSVRWPENVDPVFKIWPHFIQNGNPVSQIEINNVISAIDSVAFYSNELFNGNITGQYEIVDSLPPVMTPDVIRIYWDSSIPFNSGVGISYNQSHEVYRANIMFKFEGLPPVIYLGEVMKTVATSLHDSNEIMPSIFNYSPTINYLTQSDKNIIKANNSRAPNWKSPDTNSF